MIQVNLLPTREAQEAFAKRQQAAFVAFGVCVYLLALVIPYAYQKRELGILEVEMEALRAQLAEYAEKTKEARDLDKKVAELREKLRVIRSLDEKRVGPERVLADLAKACPEKLWLEEFSEEDGKATLVGWSLDNQTVAEFMRQLEVSPYFHGVDLSEATQPVDSGSQPRVVLRDGTDVRFSRFVITASVDYFGKDGVAETEKAREKQVETRPVTGPDEDADDVPRTS
ncbi:MAG: fimbrial protein [Candidatus Binatia bacterium]|nr:MAG: fimbrial protein [Candidatus Binatia bacterium]